MIWLPDMAPPLTRPTVLSFLRTAPLMGRNHQGPAPAQPGPSLRYDGASRRAIGRGGSLLAGGRALPSPVERVRGAQAAGALIYLTIFLSISMYLPLSIGKGASLLAGGRALSSSVERVRGAQAAGALIYLSIHPYIYISLSLSDEVVLYWLVGAPFPLQSREYVVRKRQMRLYVYLSIYLSLSLSFFRTKWCCIGWRARPSRFSQEST